MDTMFDVIVIGGGAAAASAVMTLKNRGKTVAAVCNRAETSSLYKAEWVTNYPGLPPMSGAELTALFRRQLEESGAKIITGGRCPSCPWGRASAWPWAASTICARR